MDELRKHKINEVSERLLSNLDDLLGAYKTLLDLSRSESECLQQVQLEKINEINEKKEQVLLKLRALDNIRERYARELANLVDLHDTYPRLLDLAQRVPLDLGEKMRSFHASLTLILERLQLVNQKNRLYVEAQLGALSGAINELRGALTRKGTYSRDKKMESQNQPPAILATKEA